METMTLEETVNQISHALAELEVAKEDCKAVIESALDAYFGEPANVQSKKEFKALKASQKTEARNIKKLAKAMMRGAKEEAKEEADNMQSLIETLG